MSETRECAFDRCDEDFTPSTWNQIYCRHQCKRDAENQRRRDLITDVVAAVTAHEGEEAEEDEDYVEFLRKDNARLARLAEKRKHQHRDAAEQIYQAAYDALSNIEIKPVRPPTAKSASGPEEVANPVCSDYQLGKVTASYNSDVCRERVERFGEKVLSITDVQRSDHPVDRAHVYLLGDLCEGEDIFAGQAHELDSSLYRQIVNGVEIVSDLLRRFLSHFKSVHVAGVIGNHGVLAGRRNGPYNPESNMDRLMYKFLEMMFRDEPRITFDIPEGDGERNFYTVDYIDGYGTLLVHGDQFPKPTSFHTYAKKILAWKAGSIREPFDNVVMGHYHQSVKATLGNCPMRMAGTTESDNEFAQEVVGALGTPSQLLRFVRSDIGVTAEYEIDLR